MGAIWHLETLAHPYSKATVTSVSLETGIRLVSRGNCIRSRREIFRDVALRVRGWVGLIVRILRFVCLFRIENPEPPKCDAAGESSGVRHRA